MRARTVAGFWLAWWMIVLGQVSLVWAQPKQAELYAPLTFSMAVDPKLYTNPFDANDIELLGVFHSPSGREWVIPGFWMQPYQDQCQPPCQAEDLQPAGDPTWQVRFTPPEVGTWTYSLQVRDDGAQVSSQDGQLVVAPSKRAGFIRKAPNGRYFQYQDGEPYFPIGHNLNWSWDGIGGVEVYRQWLQSLSQAGGNYARLVIDVPWFIGLEWQPPVGDYRAEQKSAARLDMILDMAAQYGVALQLVLLWHQALDIYTGAPVLIPAAPARPDTSADWDNNPYNVVNGGPLSGASVFFFDQRARELFRRRLRYIVARWGYSPQIFAWEIIDQIDRTTNYDPPTADAWLSDTASYLRQIDQQGHLITAGSQTFNATLAANLLLDFTEGQFFQRRPLEAGIDQGLGVVDVVRRNLLANNAPTLLADYSLNPWFEPTRDDPDGIHFQTSLWAAALAGAAGGAVSDWGDTYVIPQQLERYYPALAAFVSGIDWAGLNLQPAQAGFVMSDATQYGSARISGFKRQLRAPLSPPIDISITPDGAYPSLENVPAYLYGKVYSSQLNQPQTYRVAAPIDTTLEVRVRDVSPDHGARLQVSVDGQPRAELGLDKDSRNVSMLVPLTAGERRVTLDNTGEDWLELDWLEVARLAAPARVLTLQDSKAGVALAWLQHRDYTWDKAATSPQPIQGQYRLDNMPSGRYRAELWEPLSGAVLGEEIVNVNADGVLRLDLLPLDKMLALRLFRVSESAPASPTLATSTPLQTLIPTWTPTPALTSTPFAFSVVTNTPRATKSP